MGNQNETVTVDMGIGRDSRHKKRKTGGSRPQVMKKRKHEMGRPPSNTKLGAPRVRTVRCRGGSTKFRAHRTEAGNYSWGSENVTRKTRILDVVYNASNNELVRTNTLTKNTIVQIDATPFKQWYKEHYGKALGLKKKGGAEAPQQLSKLQQKNFKARAADMIISQGMDDQFASGRLLAAVSSRPGQVGRADGYILEGKELEFYVKKLNVKKSKK